MGLHSQAQKLGYLDLEALKSDMPQMLAAQSKLISYRAKLEKRSAKMLSKKSPKASAELNIPASAPIKKSKFTGKWKIIGNKFSEKNMFLMIQNKRMKLITPVIEKIDAAIKEVAEENGFQIILDRSTSVHFFADEAFDVGGLVRGKLGM